jgi:glyoxylase-like metal-dependent hydrolase (beta-lactamase superfamily II)
MKSTSYRFQIGSFECVAVLDGFREYPHPAQVLIANAAPDLKDRELKKHGIDMSSWEIWTSPYPSMVIFTGDHVVLIDTGAGNLEPSTGKLIENLRAERIEPEDIDTIIITHAHPDHIGGNVDPEGNPSFPNAAYCLFKEEWDFWTRDPDLSNLPLPDHLKEILVSFPQHQLVPIEKRVRLLDTEGQIVPGIDAIRVPGHTPGHMAVSVESEGEELMSLSDTVLHPVHLSRPDWFAAVDLDPEGCVASRKHLLDRIIASRALVHAYHFPFPGLGYIKKDGDGYQWEPIET